MTIDFETLNSPFHADVASYAKRVKDGGGYIDQRTLVAHDRFVRRGLAVGWYPAIVEMYTFCGNDLTAALTKFKNHASSGASLTNNNFVEADYDQTTGFGTTNLADTTKYLGTGVVLSTIGITNTNIGLFACPGDLPATCGLGLDIYTDPEKNAYAYEAVGNIVMANLIGLSFGSGNATLRVLGSSGNASSIRGFCDGIMLADNYPSASAALTSGGEVKIFRYKLWSSQQYAPGKIGFVAMLNVSLTQAQGADLCKAVRQLQVDIGRKAWQKMPRLGAFGDSNSVASTMHPTVIAKALGRQLINVAHNSVALAIDGTVGLPALGQFKADFADIDADLFLCMLGTNDINNNDVPVATFQATLDAFVAELVRRGKKVVVCSIPCNLYSDPTKVTNYVAAAKAVANIYGQPFLNMRNVINDKAVPADWMSDGTTHFTQSGYDEMARFGIYRMRGIVMREQIIDFGSIAAGATADSSGITVDQVAVGDRVTVTAPAAIEAGLTVTGYVSATDTVKIRVTNSTTGAIDPGSAVFTIYVDTQRA